MGNLVPRAFSKKPWERGWPSEPFAAGQSPGTKHFEIQWDKTNRERTAFAMVISLCLCLFSPSAFLVRSFLDLQPGVFAPGN